MARYRVRVHDQRNKLLRVIMGRKKTKNVKREPSGRISRAVDARKQREDAERKVAVDARKLREDAERKVAVAARMRRWGLPETLARSQMAGYPVGVLCLRWSDRTGADNAGAIDRHQHDALMRLAGLRAAYLRCIGAKAGAASPGFDMVGRGLPIIPDAVDEEEERRDANTRSAHADARRAVVDAVGLVGWTRVIEIAHGEHDVIARADIAMLRTAANALTHMWGARRRAA